MTTGTGPDGIAIIGAACRLPGADSPTEFWDNLCRGVESITFFSDDDLRAAGVEAALLRDPHYVKASPILRDVDRFDAAFFGYSPMEAAVMDPQHRLFLETCWAALEDAGYDPEATAPAVVGMFAGAGSSLTSYLVAHAGHPALQGQTAGLQHINNDKDFLATRVSYKLNLTGPSLTVQTACSTSLVAVHLACQSLLNGECDLALAGASTIRVPHASGYLAEPGSVQSPDGHCRAFDASGRGTIFGSGVVTVILKDARAAMDAGDRIYAVIRGSAVNNDGSAKVSYTAASVTGQARAVVEALEVAQVPADSVGYVECHATGTPAGDPVEIQALTRAFRTSTDRTASCAVGSVKTNIGHPEQTAGLAGLLKAALALKHGQIPPTVHFTTPNPSIPFDGSPFYVQTSLTPFPRGHTPRRACVNSLGIGGTNAFVVLEEPPEERPAGQRPSRPDHLLCLSARSESALLARARQFAAHLDTFAGDSLADLVHTANTSRSGLSHRLAVVGSSAAELADRLARLASVDRSSSRASVPMEPRPIAFLFSGQGSQHPGMSRELYRSEPRFRDALDQCEALLRPHFDRSLFDVLFPGDESDACAAATLNETAFTQPALFSVEYALAVLWQSWGITPGAVMGHSLGEIVAACIAGAIDLDEAAAFVAERARLMQALPARGAMAVCFAHEARVRRAVEAVGGVVGIASANSPRNTVVSGEGAAVEQLRQSLDRAGVASKVLAVSHAFHSALVDAILPPLEHAATRLRARAPRLTLVSNVTGQLMTDAPPPAYWSQHARQPVRFLDGMRTLGDLGYAAFVEIGPGTSALAMGRECLTSATCVWLPSLSRTRGDLRTMLESLAALYLDGRRPNWEQVSGGANRQKVALPTYPFDRTRHWLPALEADAGARPPRPETSVDVALNIEDSPYLSDHKVHGLPVVPTTTIVEAVLAAGQRHLGGAVQVEDFVCSEALMLSNDGRGRFRVVITPIGVNEARFRVVSQEHAEQSAVEKATGVVRLQHVPPALERAPSVPLAGEARAARLPEELDTTTFYDTLRASGLDYGPSFRGIRTLWKGRHEALSRVAIDPGLAADAVGLHPALLDACLHVYPALLDGHGGGRTGAAARTAIHLPIGFERLVVHRPRASEVLAHVTVREPRADEVTRTLDVTLYDEASRPVAALQGLALKPIAAEILERQHTAAVQRCLYHMSWRPHEPRDPDEGTGTPATWLLFAERGPLADALRAALARRGDTVHQVARGRRFSSPSRGHWRIDPHRREDYERVLEELGRTENNRTVRVLFLWGLDPPDPKSLEISRGRILWSRDLTPRQLEAGEAAAIGPVLKLMQALPRAGGSARPQTSPTSFSPRLWIVTRGAQAVAAGDPADPLQAMLWGFGRTAALESPRSWGGLIDLPSPRDSAPLEDDVDAVLRSVLSTDDEPQIAVRRGQAFVPRLEAFEHARPAHPPITVRSDATYLITGGLGMLGLTMARWLIERHGARSLVLVGRRGVTADSRPVIAALKAQGAHVQVMRADLAEDVEVRRVLKAIDAGLPPLKGIVHGAGVLADGILEQMDWDRFTRATAPKVRAGWLLHQHTEGRPLDFFLVHSSLLSLTGSPGQGNYTAANAFLDALVDHRRSIGLPAMAINWGPWADGGMAVTAGAKGDAMWRARGVTHIRPALGRRVMDELFARPVDRVAVALCDWPRFVGQLRASPTFFSALRGRETDTPPRPSQPSTIGLSARLAHVPAAQRLAVVVDALREQVARELGFDSGIDTARSLQSFGVDSLVSVGLANRLEASLGIRVPVVKLIRGPSLDELARDVLAGVDVGVEDREDAGHDAAHARSAARVPACGEGWLVFPRPNPSARLRLFCFNFAGGGAATYRPWADLLAPTIELVAIEPPGRATRIHEPPLTRIDPAVGAIVGAMTPHLDRPCALFGHCLGGLTSFEVARRLQQDTAVELVHLFVSGARPPHRLAAQGRFEEDLLRRLLDDPGFDPLRPLHEQPDDTFASVIRHFNIGATDEFLASAELRTLLLPSIRADFEGVWRYRCSSEPCWDLPITCFTGLDDRYVTREDALEWHRFTRNEFRVYFRAGSHFLVVDDREFIVSAINEALGQAPMAPRRRLPAAG